MTADVNASYRQVGYRINHTSIIRPPESSGKWNGITPPTFAPQ